MLEPTTPKKSPRLSLGARDLSDEHFSPQKQRLSMSLEKERRASSRTPDKYRKRVPKLDFNRPVRYYVWYFITLFLHFPEVCNFIVKKILFSSN